MAGRAMQISMLGWRFGWHETAGCKRNPQQSRRSCPSCPCSMCLFTAPFASLTRQVVYVIDGKFCPAAGCCWQEHKERHQEPRAEGGQYRLGLPAGGPAGRHAVAAALFARLGRLQGIQRAQYSPESNRSSSCSEETACCSMSVRSSLPRCPSAPGWAEAAPERSAPGTSESAMSGRLDWVGAKRQSFRWLELS